MHIHWLGYKVSTAHIYHGLWTFMNTYLKAFHLYILSGHFEGSNYVIKWGEHVCRSNLPMNALCFHKISARCRNLERVVIFQSFFSKLDLSLFRGLFFSILHQNKARVCGWDFHSSHVYCLPKHSIQHCNYGFSVVFYIKVSWLNFQLRIYMLIKVVRYSAMFPCSQIKV